jgi:molybdopterin/thiamine biosynthesis adenylyltransferase
MDSGRAVMRVVVVGAGNIGSHAIPLIARIPEVGRVLVIDRDRYEAANRPGQAITPRDVGRPKALVQAGIVRRIAPALEVSAFVGEFEQIALGHLRCDLILACVDSRRARQSVNEVAFHLGIPWIDSGVMAEGLLARVDVYVPGSDRPCLECAWDESDYRDIEQQYPCLAGAAGVGAAVAVPAVAAGSTPAPASPGSIPATNSPAALGSLAASLQAIEARKILTGRTDLAAAGRRIQIDAAHHTFYVTSFRRNPACRLGDHAPWSLVEIVAAPEDLTPERLAALLPGRPGSCDCTFAVEGRPFVLARTCTACARRRPVRRVRAPSANQAGRCAACGGPTTITGFDLRESIPMDERTGRSTDDPLSAIGVRCGDIVRVTAGETEMRFVIAGDRR